MFPSPAPSPSPSPGPAFLYLNSHGHHQSANHGGGVLGGSAGGANGASPFGPPNGAGGFPIGRFPQQGVGWGPRAHPHPAAHHQQNPSLSSLPGSLAHSSAAASMNANGAPSSPGYGGLQNHHHHPHQHGGHSSHGPGSLGGHAPSPSTIHSSGSGHIPSSASTSAAIAAASGSPHYQQQLIKAEISRQSASPHHHARAAALAARSATSSAVAITDPNKGTMHIPQTAANGLHLNSKKEAQSEETKANGFATSKDDREDENTQSWTTIDMGGLGLRKLANEVFRYDFLTSLFINHNNLTTLSPEIVKLRNLTVLDASGNKISSLPRELGMLIHLKELFLFDNQLRQLPVELGTLHNLELLGLEGNPMEESIAGLLQGEGTGAVISFLRDSCPVHLPPPERDWITLEPDLPPAADGPEPPTETFSVLCYNILAEKLAPQATYGYTPSWALAWEYRKDFLLNEIKNYDADICCLQEVDLDAFEEHFLANLEEKSYAGMYCQKTRARTMRDEEKRRVDGCAIFYKTSKFNLIEKHVIEFNQVALSRPDLKKTEDVFNRVMNKDNVAVIALLENKDSGSRLMVSNVHVHWDPVDRDVKLVQAAMMMGELEKAAERFAKLPAKLNVAEGYPPAPRYTSGGQIPTLICGDFNSTPGSGVFDFLSKGSLRGDHEDFMSHVYGNYTSDGLAHSMNLKSAYSHIGELPFTNYTPGFVGIIDYMWYNQNSLAVQGLLGEVDKTYISKNVGFPNAHFPSDHICILSEFRVKHPREGPTRKAVDFGHHQSNNHGGHRDRR